MYKKEGELIAVSPDMILRKLFIAFNTFILLSDLILMLDLRNCSVFIRELRIELCKLESLR